MLSVESMEMKEVHSAFGSSPGPGHPLGLTKLTVVGWVLCALESPGGHKVFKGRFKS